MLHINDLTYRIEGRLLFDKATAAIPSGHKVGIVGRNGTGKTTLLRMLLGGLSPDDGSLSWPKAARVGGVAQEAPGGPRSLIDTVLAADKERDSLLAEAETATDPGRIADIQLRLNDIGAHSAPARAAQILAGLGFDEDAQQRPCAEFSGGWRMRVALASVLFTAPDILLLDEPTNYLDLEGTLWLENFLAAYPHTVLIVSHDRDLLNKCVGHILHLSEGKLTLYTGGYDTFEETRRERQRLELKLKKKQDDARKHMEAFVERFRAKASKATQAQSRLKALAKMKPIAAEIENDVKPLRFPSPQSKLGNPLIRIEDASVGYADGKPVLRNLDLRLDSDDRIGLLGANGNGKSTLAKLLCGRLDLLAGTRRASNKLTFGYFAQHQLDELNPQKSAYDHIAAMMPDATEAQKRARTAAAGFGYDKADTAASKLSGGEKARLLFTLAAFNSPHLLILDEPTNHLDVDSREALIHGLNDYEGAVILISHDRHLIEATADRLWLVRDGTVTPYDGDLESYKNEYLARARDQRRGSGGGGMNGQANRNRQEERRAAANARAELAPLRKRIDHYEREIKELTKKIAQLDRALAEEGLYEQAPEKALKLMKDRGVLAKNLGETEILWLEASEHFERAQREQQSMSTP
ncbi:MULTISPECIES: ABC-F family ATP-binding cassette domain-containing protein [Rhodomicrobium]|uniref:ABC-F family ATP-binding cassette domain-containing protein n=1 Tax=Rhodomicrobium TaxID=1068 RepID=UPI000B4AA60F|nr:MULTISPECIES: ABC-F family ATP-binding cassette domain-containing protein [Rhodomicrobium]